MIFKEKLKRNFHELSHFEKVVYILTIRPFWPKEKRFFFEGSFLLIGQMYIADRKALFDTIVKERPESCFEIGTFTGGGSTYFISSAFEKIGKGKLITMESDDRLFNKAKKYYAERLPKLAPYVTFVHDTKFEALTPFIPNQRIDAFFLDGAEDGQETLDQYNHILPYCHTGTVLMAHDWNTEKTRLVRPLVEADQNWKQELVLTMPESVGFAVFKRI